MLYVCSLYVAWYALRTCYYMCGVCLLTYMPLDKLYAFVFLHALLNMLYVTVPLWHALCICYGLCCLIYCKCLLLYVLLNILHVYVKAPLRVMYEKYSTRGGVKWQIQHEAKSSAVFATRPHPECCIFRTSRVNGALTNLLGGLAAVSTD